MMDSIYGDSQTVSRSGGFPLEKLHPEPNELSKEGTRFRPKAPPRPRKWSERLSRFSDAEVTLRADPASGDGLGVLSVSFS